MTTSRQLYADDTRTGHQLVADLGNNTAGWVDDADECHRYNCGRLYTPGSPCVCGLPALLRRITFAAGLIAGTWSEAESAEPGSDRAASLEYAVRILAHAVEPTSRTESPA